MPGLLVDELPGPSLRGRTRLSAFLPQRGSQWPQTPKSSQRFGSEGIGLVLNHFSKYTSTPAPPAAASLGNTTGTRHKGRKVTQLVNGDCGKCHEGQIQGAVLRAVYSRRTHSVFGRALKQAGGSSMPEIRVLAREEWPRGSQTKWQGSDQAGPRILRC